MPAWAPSPEWKGQDAFLVGGGASLKDFDFSLLRGRNVIGCNDAYHLGPEIVSVVLFGDSAWWERNKWELEKFTGRIATCNPSLLTTPLKWLWQLKRIRDGLHSGNVLGWNYSTGAAAINLAISLGAARIFLLGYDLCQVQGKDHWHTYGKRQDLAVFTRFLRGFHSVANSLRNYPGVEVLNVTDGSSKLDTFPRIPFAEFTRQALAAPVALSGVIPKPVAMCPAGASKRPTGPSSAQERVVMEA